MPQRLLEKLLFFFSKLRWVPNIRGTILGTSQLFEWFMVFTYFHSLHFILYFQLTFLLIFSELHINSDIVQLLSPTIHTTYIFLQLFFCIFSQSFPISSIFFFPGLDTGMSGIWPGTGLETFLLSCAMPLMIHNFLEPWCRWIPCPNIPGSLNLFFPTLPCFLLSANYLFRLPGILYWKVSRTI